MDILIFCIGFVIFVTYMFFLLKMINKSHKSQERAQNKQSYKRQSLELNNIQWGKRHEVYKKRKVKQRLDK
tara:strand:- start:844 stop:1056 length:213 start_codon:yes stop_codon:yes gene_type:complete